MGRRGSQLGRILAAIGYSGIKINPERINIIWVNSRLRHGAACPFDHDRAHAYMSEPVYEIRIALGAGSAGLSFFLRSDGGIFADQRGLQQLAFTKSRAQRGF